MSFIHLLSINHGQALSKHFVNTNLTPPQSASFPESLLASSLTDDETAAQ